MKGDKDKCIGVGMDDYLAKPIRLNEVHAIINRFIQKRVSDENGVSGKAEPKDRDQAGVGTRKAIKRLVNDLDVEFVNKLINRFSEDASTRISEIIEQSSNRNSKSVQIAAHNLKGLCVMLGLEAMANSAGAIESAAETGAPEDICALISKLEPALEDAKTLLDANRPI